MRYLLSLLGALASENRSDVDRNRHYQLRMLLCTTLVVSLFVLVFNLPITTPDLRAGWGVSSYSSPSVMQEQSTEENYAEAVEENLGPLQFETSSAGPPETSQHEPGEETQQQGEIEEPEANVAAEEEDERDEIVPIHQIMASGNDDQMPEIVGGMGSLYVRIHYPRAAREQGIQGRVILGFVVEPDGQTSNVEVRQSLHPLTDSAAVRAVRNTRFVPGKQDDKAVRVRMSLPIRFTLLDENNQPIPTEDSLLTSTPTLTDGS